jgi:CheY-like chemotaxis protein
MSKKVLIVEDYDDTREFMQLVIEAFGYETLTAANGSEAVEIVKGEIPDLILMDMSMPVMDGITATEIIRNSVSMSRMPIVAVTAHGKFISTEAIKAGCNEVIAKPLDFDSFELILNQYLGH